MGVDPLIVIDDPSTTASPHNPSMSRSEGCGPQRLRLSRKAGWRKPEGAVVVSRPSQWGNHFTILNHAGQWVVLLDNLWPVLAAFDTKDEARTRAVQWYRRWLLDGEWAAGLPHLAQSRAWILEHLHELAGKDLLCWCPLPADGETDWCHARVLLDLAAVCAKEEQS